MKQTSVDFLYEFVQLQLTHEQQMQFEGLFQQAKEMEKNQIIEAHNQGSEAGYELAKNDDFIEGYQIKEAEDYINETFKSE